MLIFQRQEPRLETREGERKEREREEDKEALRERQTDKLFLLTDRYSHSNLDLIFDVIRNTTIKL